MKNKLVLTVFLLMTVASVALAAPKSGIVVPVVGSTAAGDVFEGTFRIVRFTEDGTSLYASGWLSGTLTSATGSPIGSALVPATFPVTATSGGGAAAEGAVSAMAVRALAECPILNLVLGPLDLNLLGLTVHLDQVVLDIAAETGSGNLLGNLLCAVVGLLDGAGLLADIANLLNRILDVLSGVLG